MASNILQLRFFECVPGKPARSKIEIVQIENESKGVVVEVGWVVIWEGASHQRKVQSTREEAVCTCSGAEKPLASIFRHHSHHYSPW